jgi:hypothetical protein
MSDAVQSSVQQVVPPSSGLRRIAGAAVRFIKVQGRESSTYRGLVMILTACGVYLKPELVAAITSAGMGLAGLIAVLLPDNAPPAE